MTSPIQDKEPEVSRALVRAASSGDLEAIKSLLAAGADVDCANESGQTALILAAVMGHRELVAHLISAGADPRLRDRLGLTALEWSTRRGFADVSQFLTRVSPPLRKPQAEREADSKTTVSHTQPIASVTQDAEPAHLGAPSAAIETLTASSEKQVAAEPQTHPLQLEVIQTATTEGPSESDAIITNFVIPQPAVDDSLALTADEIESPPAAAELATESATPPSAIDDSPAVVATEPESQPAAAELETESATPPSAIDDSPAVVSNEPELKPASAKLATDSAAQPPAVEDSPAVADEPESQPAAAELATDSPAQPPALEDSPAVADERESQWAAAELATDSAAQLSAFDDSPAVVPNEPESEPASPHLELQPISVIEPSSEIKDPGVTATPILNLESPDSDPEAAAMISSEPLVLHEEDETLPQRKAYPSVFDFTLPDEPVPAASSETRTDAPPAIQVPAQRKLAAAFSGSPLALANTTAEVKEADVSNLKRCPRCGAVYQNSPLSFCTRDNATLISINELHPLATPAQTSATPIAVWLLIAFVLGASGFAAYRLTERFYRQPQPTPVEVKPIEAPPVPKKPAFRVGGDLAGSELNVPEPEYPSQLATTGITGPITVRIRVNKNGRVISAATSQGDSRLRAAAVKAARLATFAPDKLAELSPRGRTVAGSITYDFAAPQTNATPSTSSNSPTASASPGASPVPSTSATANADPDAPVVSNELMGAASNVPAADYPTRAKRAGIGGAITVTVRVSRAGRVISWRTSTGDSQLRAAAIKAVRRATFSREKLPGNGDVVGTITYNFTP